VEAEEMIAWIIAFILFLCLLAVLAKLRLGAKELAALNDRCETAQWEAKNQSVFSEQALEEVEKWKKCYVTEKAAKEEHEKEAEQWKKRYWEKAHEDSDSYKTQIGKDEESWGDIEPY
jgi:hypothetical protein